MTTSKATAPDGALAATQPSVAKALKWLTDAQSLWMHGKDGPSHQFVIEAMAELRAVETASARQKDELVAKVEALPAKPSDKALVAAYDLAETCIGRLKTVLGNESITSAGKETLKDVIKDSRKLLKQLDKLSIIEEEANLIDAALTAKEGDG